MNSNLKCSKCNIEKEKTEFYKLKNICKNCKKEVNHLYYKNVYRDVAKSKYIPHGRVGRPFKIKAMVESV